MKVSVPAERVYESEGVPEYEWETYQRGFLGILNNAYNQSCNAGTHTLGVMSDVESGFVETMGSGSWQDFVRYYVHEHDGHERVERSIRRMADNLQDRVGAIGGYVPRDRARFWARKYIWSMVKNSYTGFCSERTAIGIVADSLGVPHTTDGSEPDGIDGLIGDATVQVKPESYLGIDLNDHEADYVITYTMDGDDYVFDVPDDLTPMA
jgi:hypothetical protein